MREFLILIRTTLLLRSICLRNENHDTTYEHSPTSSNLSLTCVIFYLLCKDYVHEPLIRFDSKYFNWTSDISCKVDLVAPGLGTLFSFIIYQIVAGWNCIAAVAGGIGLIRNPFKRYDPVANFSAVRGGSSLISIGTDLAFDISAGTLDKFNASFSFNSDFVSASLSLDKLDT